MPTLKVRRDSETVVEVVVPAVADRPAFVVRLELYPESGVVDVRGVGAEHVAPLGIPMMRVRGVLSTPI